MPERKTRPPFLGDNPPPYSFRVISAIPRLRQAILTALYGTTTALYGDTASFVGGPLPQNENQIRTAVYGLNTLPVTHARGGGKEKKGGVPHFFSLLRYLGYGTRGVAFSASNLAGSEPR